MTDPLSHLRTAVSERYQIERELGRGGMATVYLAHDLRHERKVALKVLKPELARAIGPARFLREIRIAAPLHHPHILPLYDSGSFDWGLGVPGLYYVMPFVAGESLRDRLRRELRIPLDEALRITREVADALSYAHAHGIVHRDIKPENILLEAGHATVADFGIARALSAAGESTMTETGMAVGTPSYMSPEQISGESELDGRSDLYSLGCVVYEMLAGRPPVTGPTPQAIIAKQAVEPAPSLRSLRPDLSPAIEQAVAKALAKSAAERYQTATELATALDASVSEGRKPVVRRKVGRPLIWLGVVAAILVVFGAAVLWPRGRTVFPTISPTSIAVLPFSVGGNDSLGLGQGMVNLLGTKLDGAGDLRTVDPRAVLSFVARAPRRQPLDPDRGRVIAEHFSAGLYVLGDLLEIGGRLRLSASLYDVRRGETMATASAEGNAGRVFELVDSLASQLLAGWGGKESRLTAIAAVTTSSLPALKAYLEGESALRAGSFDAAVESFQRAVAADTLFALAWYRVSVAAEWLTRADIARSAAEHAVRLSSRLSEHDRQLLEALMATRRGASREAERLYRGIIGTYPNEVEGRIQLGEVLFHYGPWTGRSVSESREVWEQVLAFEPDFVAAMVHLARIAAVEGRLQEVDSLVRRIEALRRSARPQSSTAVRSESLEMEALRAFTAGNPADEDRVLERLRNASDLTVVLAVWMVSGFVGDLEGGGRVANLLTERSRSVTAQVLGRILRAHLQLGLGRWAAARAEIATAEPLDPTSAAEYRALLAAAPFLPTSAHELRAARAGLARELPSPAPAVGASALLTTYSTLHRPLRTYLLGVLCARLGEPKRAARYAEELDRMESPPDAGTLIKDLSFGIRAESAWQGKQAGGTLAVLQQMRSEIWYELATASPFFAESRERFLRGEAYNALGRSAEALQAYASLSGQTSTFDVAYLAPAEFRRGEIAERLGRPREAGDHYARFVELWRGADPELQPLVTLAKTRLAALKRGEPER